MQWIKSLFGTKPASSSSAIPLPAASEIEVPRYPPFMKGLPVVEPEKLLSSQAEILAQYKRSVIVDAEQYEKHYMGALRRFASYAHLVPASQSHHHRGAGGLLRHSMEVALGALQGADKMLLNVGKTPAQRRSIEPRWQLTAFLAGLCHDVGKPATDITITSNDRSLTWKPLTQDLHVWAKQSKISSYFIDWRTGRGKQHIALSNLIAERIIGPESLQWIEEGGTDLVVWLMEALNGSPGATNPLYDLVIRADQSSVERDLKSMGVAMAGYELGVPVERHLTDIMRRLIKEGIWQINEPSARVWNIEGGIYLVWPAAGEEIAHKVREDGVPGFPRTHDGILDMLRERGLAFIREGDGDRFWKIAPAVLEAKIPNISLTCIRLRDDTLISSVPIPVVAGKLRNAEEVEGDIEESENPKVSAGQVQQVLASAKPAEQMTVANVEPQSSSPARSGGPDRAAADLVPTAQQTPKTIPAEVSGTVKPPLAKFTVDQQTGEILGVESGDPNAKKQPSLRPLPTGETSPAKQGISKPTGLKLKAPVAPEVVQAEPPAAETATPDGPKPKKTRKKRDFTKEPELKFTGSVGELFLALADDLINGAKKWGQDVRVDEEEMVLLRWPASFANYGLSGKNILDECTKNKWIWVNQDMPFVRLVDATFEGEPCKALRLMPDPGDALLFHAKYNAEEHSTTAPQKPKKEPEAKPDPVGVPNPHPSTVALNAPEKSLGVPVDVAAQEVQAKRHQPRTEQIQSIAKDGRGQDLQPAHKKKNAAPKAESAAVAKTATHDVKPEQIEVPLTPPAQQKPSTSVNLPPSQRVEALFNALALCPAIKIEAGWRHVERGDLRRIALESGAAKDRKDLNLLIEENAKILQVNGSMLRYLVGK